MNRTRYRTATNSSAATAGRKVRSALPIALLGLSAYALWQKRDQVGGWVEQLKSKLGTASSGGQPTPAEVIPDDYDYNRPSVFNSTAMAGPRGDAAGAAAGIDGGSMGTDLGTHGEGAL